MGYNIVSWRFVHKTMKEYDKDTSSRICLLGNLHLHRGLKKIVKRHGTRIAQKYYEKAGYGVVSIDINGKDGALPYNLEKPLPNTLGTFDVIVNGGTTEHIKKQYKCFQNIHNICRIDGLMFHIVPVTGHWPKHAYYTYSKSFFRDLANKCGYALIDMFVSDYVSKMTRKKQDFLIVALRKEYDKPFGGLSQDLLQRIN